MAPLPDFSNRDRFPTFTTIPEAGAPVKDDGQQQQQQQEEEEEEAEWYLLAHIKNDMTIAKPTLVVEDRDGSPFAVVFEGYGRDDLDLKARGLKKGNTIVLPRARRVPPADETKRGFVRVDRADAHAVKAVPGALERVLALAGVEEDATVCSACGGKGEAGGGLSSQQSDTRNDKSTSQMDETRLIKAAKRAAQRASVGKTLIPLKQTPQYVTQDTNPNGGRKHGHYAQQDPDVQEDFKEDESLSGIQPSADMSWEDLRQRWGSWSLPEQPMKDLYRSGLHRVTQTVTTRDGAKIKIRITRRLSESDGGYYGQHVSPDIAPGSTPESESTMSTPGQVVTGNTDPKLLVLRFCTVGWVGHVDLEASNTGDEMVLDTDAVLVDVYPRLAPEYAFPHALNDCYDTLIWCQTQAQGLGIDRDRIVLLGADAGANLAACVALKAQDKGVAGIAAQILEFPLLCHPKFYHKARSFRQEITSPAQCGTQKSQLPLNVLELYWDSYVPDAEVDTYHSPLLAEQLSLLPPTFIQIAGFDAVRDEAIAYANRLREACVTVEQYIYPGLPHMFPWRDPSKCGEFLEKRHDYIKRVTACKGVFAKRRLIDAIHLLLSYQHLYLRQPLITIDNICSRLIRHARRLAGQHQSLPAAGTAPVLKIAFIDAVDERRRLESSPALRRILLLQTVQHAVRLERVGHHARRQRLERDPILGAQGGHLFRKRGGGLLRAAVGLLAQPAPLVALLAGWEGRLQLVRQEAEGENYGATVWRGRVLLPVLR
ncbi:hypothetical protein PpBr36_08188 [Pyricularia pennisetigena]|uniref:hypothetical protein n=1 Tax=Pyricularia pennisetigena TaxID=1578925 RepID=UPI0011544A3A|nr:hypothetical protein PpBr36_08188 [Pyricularia pennisetigena]TLS24479.1 hypothetical protein PpBr36_08188 [Pyricularia pennisetigena]